ncbi:MAG: HD domain-containing protein [Bacillota bacterium]|nr:HD domain-containing protein [Bacillota bacterium]
MAAKRTIETYAVIDVGSNQLTLKIAEVRSKRRPRVIEVVRGALALGRDTYNEQQIRNTSLKLCIEILQGFEQKLREYDVRDWRVVATSAIREAANREFVLARIAQETGFEVEVLDNNVERFYHLRALTSDFEFFSELKQKKLLLVDVGSGSLQISNYESGRLCYSHNVLLGALRVYEMMNQLRERTRDYTRLLDEYITCELNDFELIEEPGAVYDVLVAIGPEMLWLKRLAGMDPGESEISLEAFGELTRRLSRESSLTLTTREGVPADMADQLLPTAIILDKYVRHRQIHQLHLLQTDLSDGLILEHAERWYQLHVNPVEEADLLSMVHQLARRFRYDEQHVRYVETQSMMLFDRLARRYSLGDRQRLLLRIAAVLHDVGKFVRLNYHADQSFEIIRHLDLLGLTDLERLQVAYIASFHSASRLPTVDAIEGLDATRRRQVLELAAILRLADGLDSSHRQKLGEVSCDLFEEEFVIHIRTDQDATLETAVSQSKSQLFSAIFGLRVVFDVQGPR